VLAVGEQRQRSAAAPGLFAHCSLTLSAHNRAASAVRDVTLDQRLSGRTYGARTSRRTPRAGWQRQRRQAVAPSTAPAHTARSSTAARCTTSSSRSTTRDRCVGGSALLHTQTKLRDRSAAQRGSRWRLLCSCCKHKPLSPQQQPPFNHTPSHQPPHPPPTPGRRPRGRVGRLH